MRANIPEELLDLIDEKIYLDLEIHVLNQKLEKLNNKDNQGFATYIQQVIKKVTNKRKEVSQILNENNIKIYDPKTDEDGEFVTYFYAVKVNGGYKQGTMRYWKAAMKLNLKKRMGKYFK